jgi:hypothetical protein
LEPDSVGFLRTNCAVGDDMFGSNMIVKATKASLALGTAELCVTVLTRAGRDGTLRYITLGGDKMPSSLAFDTGFVNGYLKRDAVPAAAPAMTTLLPVANRCLNEQEPNMRLCSSAGYVLGARAAQGELVSSS